MNAKLTTDQVLSTIPKRHKEKRREQRIAFFSEVLSDNKENR